MVLYPDIGDWKNENGIFVGKDRKESFLVKYLENFISTTYVHTMTLSENMLEEKKLEQELNYNINWDEYAFFTQYFWGFFQNVWKGPRVGLILYKK